MDTTSPEDASAEEGAAPDQEPGSRDPELAAALAALEAALPDPSDYFPDTLGADAQAVAAQPAQPPETVEPATAAVQAPTGAPSQMPPGEPDAEEEIAPSVSGLGDQAPPGAPDIGKRPAAPPDSQVDQASTTTSTARSPQRPSDTAEPHLRTPRADLVTGRVAASPVQGAGVEAGEAAATVTGSEAGVSGQGATGTPPGPTPQPDAAEPGGDEARPSRLIVETPDRGRAQSEPDTLPPADAGTATTPDGSHRPDTEGLDAARAEREGGGTESVQLAGAPQTQQPNAAVAERGPGAAQPDPATEAPAGRQGRTRGRSLAGIALLLVAGAGAVLVPFALRGSAAPELNTGSAGAASASSNPTPGGMPGRSSPAQTAPPGFRLQRDPSGFSVAIPIGWTVNRSGGLVEFRDPSGDRFLRIYERPKPRTDPYDDWIGQEAAAHGWLTGYNLIRVTRLRYRGWPAADWEFTWGRGETRMHVLNRNVVPDKTRGYALYWSTPDSRWAADRSIFDVAARTFTPAG